MINWTMCQFIIAITFQFSIQITSFGYLFSFLNCQLFLLAIAPGGEYRSRTDDLLLAKQAL
jgi:hypothetical protein